MDSFEGFNNTFNTIGLGDVVPAGGNSGLGSGDKMTADKKTKINKKKGPENPFSMDPRPLIVYK